MLTLEVVAVALVGLGIIVVLGRVFARSYLRYRGDRLITCPENEKPAGVRVNAWHSLVTRLEGQPELRLSSCSRWPEKKDCGQECLHQIEASPEDCLVRNILAHWYAGKACALCGQTIGEINWTDHKPALLSPAHQTVQWHQLRPPDVPEVLRTHLPVCWNCHIVSTVMRQHPELVTDRSRPI